MQAANQTAANKIAIPKISFIWQSSASAFSEKTIFNPKAATSVPRFVSSSVRLSPNSKTLTWTTTLKIQHLIIAELDDKEIKVPVIGIQIKGNKEKVLTDTGASASFVATEWC